MKLPVFQKELTFLSKQPSDLSSAPALKYCEPNKDEANSVSSVAKIDTLNFIFIADYVFKSLKPSQLINWPCATEQYFKDFVNLVQELIDSSENDFTLLIMKINLTQENIHDSFKRITDEVLLKDEIGITWTRIAILYAFATSMAKYCHVSAEFLHSFSETVGKHIEYRTGSWIEKQGGWAAMNVGNKSLVESFSMIVVELGSVTLGVAAAAYMGIKSASLLWTSLLNR